MYTVDLSDVRPVAQNPLGEKFEGSNGAGETVGFTSSAMTVNGRPFFGISGEIHFCRVRPDQWEDAVAKAKAGGVNIVSTYVFWNVHEETEGVFRFDGCRDLRAFLAVCKREKLRVILRIGPFNHGEMRNGGLPDWLYGKPFEVRGDAPGYLACVRRYFAAVHAQVDGFYFSQCGPVVGIQIENEYMHAAAPWEIPAGRTEWMTAGDGGNEHMRALKRIAMEEGLITPFYTCTAWGGAMTPTDEMLPLWSGYAYQPWLLRDGPGEHPCTPEYIYRDNHNDAVRSTYEFAPRYDPESMPYACCELMGGMTCSYNYRFTLPHESIDALANIKLGSGCSLLGYYMYRGGITPRGERTPFLSEGVLPRMNYDYQAPIGAFGQLRPSYFRLRALHDFCTTFARKLLAMRTVLPYETDDMNPRDTRRLRFAARVRGDFGFLFINNFQDHFDMPDRREETIALRLPGGELRVTPVSIAGGENAILPFNLDMDGKLLRFATAQPITHFDVDGVPCWFFFAPRGMKPVFVFADGERVEPEEGKTSSFIVSRAGGELRVVVLTRADGMRFSHLHIGGREVAVLSDTGVYARGDQIVAEAVDGQYAVMSFPREALGSIPDGVPCENDVFAGYAVRGESLESAPLQVEQVGPSRWAITVEDRLLTGHKAVLLRAAYAGDIAEAFIDGEMIGDDFCNGQPWDIRLDCHRERLREHPLTLYIIPNRDGARLVSLSLHTLDDAVLPLR